MESIIVGIINLFLLVGLLAAIGDGLAWAVRRHKRKTGRRA